MDVHMQNMPRKKINMRTGFLVLALLTVLAWAGPAAAQEQQTSQPMHKAAFPSLESAIRLKGPIFFCGERVPIERADIRERLEKELLLMLWDRAQVILWLKRTGRYFPHIQTILRGATMPDDLKYIAVIESALKPHAGSRKGARGIWQFIPTTGRNYGLTVNRSIDERRNFRLATRAAVRYLADLYDMFDSWTLAAAAYNMGEVGLQKRMKQQDEDDYYKLDLPTETERYVLRAVAAKLILSHPAYYGFNLVPDDFYRARKYDRVRLKNRRAAPVLIVAKAAGTHYKDIKDLNPQLLSDVIPSGEHVVFLPEGAAQGFAARYQPLIAEYRKHFKGKTYTVRRGDTLTAIARKNNLPLWRLLKYNNLHRRSVIRPGQKLVIMK